MEASLCLAKTHILTLVLSAQEHKVICSYIDRTEKRFGVTFEEGRNPDVEFMAHLWEPLRWMHKPLVVYVCAECIWLSTDCLLRALGFRAYKHDNVSAPQGPAQPFAPDSSTSRSGMRCS